MINKEVYVKFMMKMQREFVPITESNMQGLYEDLCEEMNTFHFVGASKEIIRGRYETYSRKEFPKLRDYIGAHNQYKRDIHSKIYNKKEREKEAYQNELRRFKRVFWHNDPMMVDINSDASLDEFFKKFSDNVQEFIILHFGTKRAFFEKQQIENERYLMGLGNWLDKFNRFLDKKYEDEIVESEILYLGVDRKLLA